MMRLARGSLVTGMFLGALLCLAFQTVAKKVAPKTPLSDSTPEVKVLLHSFQLQPDKLDEFEQWMLFEHEHHAETLATLEREKMYVEAIFRDVEHAPRTIYWLEVRGANGAQVENSPLPIDKVYERFMADTILPHSHVKMNPEYLLTPDFLRSAISAHNAASEKN